MCVCVRAAVICVSCHAMLIRAPTNKYIFSACEHTYISVSLNMKKVAHRWPDGMCVFVCACICALGLSTTTVAPYVTRITGSCRLRSFQPAPANAPNGSSQQRQWQRQRQQQPRQRKHCCPNHDKRIYVQHIIKFKGRAVFC